MPLPDLFLVGAPKAGTTSLADWIGQHPDVFWSVPKEPFHWSSDFPGQRAFAGYDDPARYAALFDSAEARAARVRAEGSTTYLYSHSAVPAILAAVPEARFVVSLRHPATLVPAYHRTQLLARNEDESDFSTAWARSLAGRGPQGVRPTDAAMVDYPRIGRLGEAVERLLDVAGPDRVHVVTTDDLRRDPGAVMDGVWRFLGLPAHPVDLAVRNTGDQAPRSERLADLVNRPPRWLAPAVHGARSFARRRSGAVVTRLRRLAWQERPRDEVSPQTLAELAEHFAADQDLLAGLIGRRLDSPLPPAPTTR